MWLWLWVRKHLPSKPKCNFHFRFGGWFFQEKLYDILGLSKQRRGFVQMVLEVCKPGSRGLPTCFPRFGNLVLLRWRASSSPLTGVGGCRAPKGSRSGNAGVVASYLTCGARARPRGSRGIGATRAVRSRRWKNKTLAQNVAKTRGCPRVSGTKTESATMLMCGACPPTRGIAATCAVSKAHEKRKTPPGSRGGGEW